MDPCRLIAHWQTSVPVSCFHTAAALLQGRRPTDAALAEALAEPAARLRQALREERVPERQFFSHLLPLTARIDNTRQWAEVALTKTIGHAEAQFRVRRIRDLLDNLREVFAKVVPSQAHDALPRQSEPLRQCWNYHGAGLLAGAVNWTEPEVLVEDATVVVLPPVLGAGGTAYPAYNVACIEAAADDPLPDLPEVLRLAWLLAQLNLDLPRYTEAVRAETRNTVAGLALIPVVLVAAEAMQLVDRADVVLRRAVETWLIPGNQSDAWSTVLEQWWDVYCSMRPSWSAALQALDQMLREAESQRVMPAA